MNIPCFSYEQIGEALISVRKMEAGERLIIQAPQSLMRTFVANLAESGCRLEVLESVQRDRAFVRQYTCRVLEAAPQDEHSLLTVAELVPAPPRPQRMRLLRWLGL